jgi:vacuolar-type H+-ATPase subunit F/Vma7
MPIAINGTGTVTGFSTGGISDAKAVADAAMPAGAVIQVIQTTKTNAFTTTSSSATDVTGLTASITPTSSSNKILVIVSLGTFNNQESAKRAALNIVRGSTNVLVGDAETGHEVTALTCTRSKDSQGPHVQIPFSFTVLDSPSTTSSTTYKLQIFTTGDGGTATINRPGSRDAFSGNTASTLVLMEVAA